MKKIYKIVIGLGVFTIGYFGVLTFLKKTPEISILVNNKCKSTSSYEIKDGIKILTLNSCNSYENGFFHGQKLKNEINEMISFLKNDLLIGDRYLGSPIYSILQYKSKKFIPYIPQENLKEMKGIADGAGVSFNDILLINTYDDMLKIMACSSMIIPKQEGFNKYFIHTRNLDYPIKILAKNKIILKYKTHLSVGFPGYIGVLTGIGKKGLTLSNHSSYSKNKAQYGIPSGLLYRKILIEAENIDEAKNILKNARRTIGNNLMIGNYKENKGIVAEFDVKEIAFREIGKNDKILVSTNHYRSEKMKKIAKSKEGARYNQYFEKMSQIKKVNIKDIEKILGYYKNTKHRSSIANNGTVQSVIMMPESKKLYIANGTKIPVTSGKYVEINFNF